jgi:phosphinothricin acetyltransferase
MTVIRKASMEDLPAITDIYNDAVLNLTASFDTQPKTVEEQKKWFGEHHDQFPVMVAESEGRIVGWASLSRWSDRCAYSSTAEASLYVNAKDRNNGLGRKLIYSLLEEGRKAGLHTVIARIVAGNAASIHLCESLGFTHIGTMKEVGRKFGKLLDVEMMQKIFPE